MQSWLLSDLVVKMTSILFALFQDKHGHRNAYALWGDAFLFVYSVADRRSFDEISNIKRDVENALKTTNSLPVILVANKNDLRKELRYNTHV